MQQHTTPVRAGARAWCIWSLSALAFGYAFFQRVAPSVMVPDLMAEFSIGAAVTGYLSALYFYPYVALQFPLGALLDRFGVRRLLTAAIGLAAAGSFLFAMAQSIEQAYVGRMLIGIGSAVGFLSSLTLAAKWFPPQRFAFLAGLVMLFGTGSGVAAQAPLAALIAQFGWRNAMLGAACFATLLCLAIAIFVRNSPDEQSTAQPMEERNWSSFLATLKSALAQRQIWLISIVAMTMTGPMLAFAGLWGVPFVMAEYQLPRPEAAFYVSMMLFGWAAGAPIAGWLSDRIGRRKTPIVAAAIIQVVLMGAVALVPGIPISILTAIMFAIGMCGSGMVISFALAREVSEPAIHGSVSGMVNALTVASGAILQPIIGVLLDWQWDGTLIEGARAYTPEQYRFAFWSLLAWTVAGALLATRLRETYCTTQLEHDRL
ncbi:MAG: MFS transporter [Rhizobiales bacterium]|nr:MFS transporter [Hyphomicrobiales bacterium]